jgi:uncharacterized protein YecT (DUF1311 family)
MRIGVALAAILVVSTAWAGPMMPPGPSPEPGLAGVWRFIGAERAPWAGPRKLTRKDAPLLEYAVDFEANEVKGPALLACKGAKYQSGIIYRNELFGGKLGGESNANALALTNGEVTTFRVTCGTNVRDFYIDDHADLRMADGTVIYTLERPTGMDTEQYTAGFSGPSFDCTKAKSEGEKLICTDAALAASDKKLGAAWRALKTLLSAESFATFQAGQRAWIAYAMKSCGADTPSPNAHVAADCLKDEFDGRTDLLQSAKVFRSGPLTIEPRLRFRTRANPETEETDIISQMRGGPEADAFNAFIAHALKLDRWRMDDKALFQYGDTGDAKLHAHRFYSIGRFDARIVSFDVSTSDFVGGHDEERSDRAFTWDMRAGREVFLDDVFAKDANWKKFVLDTCMRDLKKQIDQDGAPGDLTASDLAKQLADSGSWSWAKDRATVTFVVFMDSGMPQSLYGVSIPYKALRPYMKPDAPVL